MKRKEGSEKNKKNRRSKIHYPGYTGEKSQ